MKCVLGLVALILFGLASDSHPFTYEALQQVDRNVTFPELQRDPEDFVGTDLILGGTIVAIGKMRNGLRLEISQLPLDAADQPRDGVGSFGRFLATVSGNFKTGEFRIGTLVTLIGTVKSAATETEEDEESVYPILAVREIRIWQEPGAYSGSVSRFERETSGGYVYGSPSYPDRGYYYEPYSPWLYFPWWFNWTLIFGSGNYGHDHGYGGGSGRYYPGGPVRRGR
jgi:outer membrane lipoprotein